MYLKKFIAQKYNGEVKHAINIDIYLDLSLHYISGITIINNIN